MRNYLLSCFRVVIFVFSFNLLLPVSHAKDEKLNLHMINPPGPIMLQTENKLSPNWGIGHFQKGSLQKTKDGKMIIELVVDMRTFKYANNNSGFNILHYALQTYEDPWLMIRATIETPQVPSSDANTTPPAKGSEKSTINVVWRGRSKPVKGHCSITPLKHDNLHFSFDIELELKKFNLRLKKWMKSNFSEKIKFSGQANFGTRINVVYGKDYQNFNMNLHRQWGKAGKQKVTLPLLLKVLAMDGSKAHNVMKAQKIDLPAILRQIKPKKSKSGKKSKWIEYDKETSNIIRKKALQITKRTELKERLSTHILLALLQSNSKEIDNILEKAHVDKKALEKTLMQDLKPAVPMDQHVETLGNPFREKYKSGARIYARNVWDMKAYDGKIYLGHGNSSNSGPATNAGPVDIWCWDPGKKEFLKEFTVDDEQIDHYYASSKYLMTPGHDPRESWSLGNMYVYKDKKWEKIRTIPRGIHCYDLIEFDSRLFAALGTRKGAEVAISSDDGKTWESHILKNGGGRAFTLFVINKQLYVSNFQSLFFAYKNNQFVKINVNLFPDTDSSKTSLLVRPTPFLDELVYLGANSTNDHQWTPFGLFAASDITQARRIKLPPNDTPYDIKVDGDWCYVLTNERLLGNAKEECKVKIWKSKNLQDWTAIFSFKVESFVRSFEILNGDFYFGIGCHTSNLSKSTGNILRIKKQFLPDLR